MTHHGTSRATCTLPATALAVPGAATAQSKRYPDTTKLVGVPDAYHRTKVADPYHWREVRNAAGTAVARMRGCWPRGS